MERKANEAVTGGFQEILSTPLLRKDDEPTSAILSVLEQFVTEVPGVKFFA